MENIKKYITYFKTCIGSDKAGKIIVNEGQLPYYKYSNEVSYFVKDFYNLDSIDCSYSSNIFNIDLLAQPNDLTSLMT